MDWAVFPVLAGEREREIGRNMVSAFGWIYHALTTTSRQLRRYISLVLADSRLLERKGESQDRPKRMSETNHSLRAVFDYVIPTTLQGIFSLTTP